MRPVLEPGLEVLPGYSLVRFLGAGGFGEVWEAVAPGGVPKAIKATVIGKSEEKRNSRELEGVQRIHSIRHPYLLSIERYDVIDGVLYIVMELADKSLADRFDDCTRVGLVGVPRDELLAYMTEAAEALDLINKKHGLYHMDVKPENLFLMGGHLKLADFGMVQNKRTSGSTEPIAITPPYAAPEVFDGFVEESVDQYSLAVTYMEMLTGHRPYTATDVRGIVYQHLRMGPNVSALPPCDRPVILRALRPDPNQRFSSCLEFIEELQKAGKRGDVTPRPWVPTMETSPTTPVDMSKAAFVMHPAKQRVEKTTSVTNTKQKTVQLDTVARVETSDSQLRAHFVAFLPLEIFAHKLRGFIMDLGAETLHADVERTVLRFRQSGLFSGRKAIFLQIDTCTKNPHSGFRAVEVTIWSASDSLSKDDVARRGIMLVRYLKAHMMAVESEPLWGQLSGAQIRAALFGD
jgi:serine/threonine protein kinase